MTSGQDPVCWKAMLSPTWSDFNLWLHIIAASVWIGGQITVGAVVPMLRSQRDTVVAVARRFQTIGWPAFALIFITGLFNIHNAGLEKHLGDSDAGRTVLLKLGLFAISGLAAAIHAYVIGPRIRVNSTSSLRMWSGILGALSLLAALAAALYGVSVAEARQP